MSWEAKEKNMDKVFWFNFHSVMFMLLMIMSFFSQVVKEGKDIGNNLKKADESEQRSIGEAILIMGIVLFVALAFLKLILYIVTKNPTASVWFVGIYMIVYAYIAIKQMIKMLFIPENRAFSIVDIKSFICAYMVWYIMMAAMNSSQPVVDILNEISSNPNDMVKVVMLLFGYYFNLLFSLGGTYILLYYLWKLGKRLEYRFHSIIEKIKSLIDKVCVLFKHGDKVEELKCFRLWKENNGKGIIYKILLTTPLLVFDIFKVTCKFIKILVKTIFIVVITSILDPIKASYKYIRKLWNRHENNEWMYVLAQLAGLCSYVIVFLIIQYGEYQEVTKNVYEFAGTIILIPYFLGKIIGLKQNIKEINNKVSGEKKENVVPENMTYNEDGEGVINGKTIRQLEYEVMQYTTNNPKSIKLKNKELSKKLHKIGRETFRKNVVEFIENNIEILVGISVSVCLVCIYFIFRKTDIEQNGGLIGSIVGAEGTIISVLLTIAFTKKSNKKTLGASVLPYITIEKEKEPVEGAYAFEYVKDKDQKRDFSIWRAFDFNEIRNDRIKLVRNGIAYLHIKNIGIGPAIHLKMKIENFSSVYLPIDYLKPDDEIYVILNFGNPKQSFQTDIIIEYETIRGDKHTQKYKANITWHLDRTNFTLFN